MAKIVAVSIDLTKIDKTKVKTVTRQNGEVAKFYDLEFVVNDETDKFGNDAAVRTRLSKDEREAGDKPVYLGNGKTVWSSEAKPLPQTSAPTTLTEDVQAEDGLPW
jgi:hypothetical protein